MADIGSLLSALDERTIAQEVALAHDEARMRYPLHANTVRDFDEFTDLIGHYYNYHFTTCVSGGGSLPKTEACGRAKEILESEYRRRGGGITTAFNDAHEGTNGSMRAILDLLSERLKAESVHRYVRDIFDRQVAPNSWEDKVEIIRQFISQCGRHLSSSIRSDQPERYAHDFESLIRSYIQALQQTSSMFRRL
jgi:hypothetical protein